jgi:ParB/RepB/Spo0J family partition protein
MKQISVYKIEYDVDRIYGGDGAIEILAENIRRVGLINPLVVQLYTLDTYRIIAGRRRFKAIKLLGWETVPAIIVDVSDDKATEIALSENANRQDMHPLDEAAAFKDLFDSGMTLQDIARCYERSVSAIYQRIRLVDLNEALKTMFQEGKMNLSSASMLASLTPEQQAQFYELNENTKVGTWMVNDYLHKVQHCKLVGMISKACTACTSRTHHTDPELFLEYNSLQDVCFDEKCYAKKWVAAITKQISEAQETEPETVVDNNLFLHRNIPVFYPEGASTLKLKKETFRVLDRCQYDQTEEGSPDAISAWYVSLWGNELLVTQGFYRTHERAVRDKEESRVWHDITTSLDVPTSQVAEIETMLDKKYANPYGLQEEIKEAVLHQVVQHQKPTPQVIDLFFAKEFEDNERAKELFCLYTGEAVFTLDAAKKLSLEEVCMLLMAQDLRHYDVPDLALTESDDFEASDFIRFSGLTKAEFIALYKATTQTLVMDVLTDDPEGPPSDSPEESEEDMP